MAVEDWIHWIEDRWMSFTRISMNSTTGVSAVQEAHVENKRRLA